MKNINGLKHAYPFGLDITPGNSMQRIRSKRQHQEYIAATLIIEGFI